MPGVPSLNDMHPRFEGTQEEFILRIPIAVMIHNIDIYRSRDFGNRCFNINPFGGIFSYHTDQVTAGKIIEHPIRQFESQTAPVFRGKPIGKCFNRWIMMVSRFSFSRPNFARSEEHTSELQSR